MEKDTMRSVVFKGPYQVELEDRPIPQLKEPTDIIIKVEYTALCGRSRQAPMLTLLTSELHVFRGHEHSDTGFIMGHEFTGRVVDTGSSVITVKRGDMVVSPFTISCGNCFYCGSGYSSRCEKSLAFGTSLLDGGQAEYVRIPLADSTVMKAPEGIEILKLCLLADIWPTGYFAAANAFRGMEAEQVHNSTVVVIGCGPVGLCALINALDHGPKHLLAVDGVQSRLDIAKTLGAETWDFQTDREGLNKRVKELTDGRGADTVIEVVGLSAALRTAFDLLRPWGNISSVGVHNGEIPWTGTEAYGKNLRIQMGRCPVRSIFPQALEKLRQKQHLLNFMTDQMMPLSQALEGYQLFHDMKAQKVIFKADE